MDVRHDRGALRPIHRGHSGALVSLKTLLLEVLETEAARLAQKAKEGLLTDDEVARIPALAMAAERVEKLRAGNVEDERDAAELEASLRG